MRVSIRKRVVKRHLARKNLSQNWLAERIGTTSGYMSQMMNGTRSPSPKMREKIMQILSGYSFDDLFKIKNT